jgi:hypothetical protein
MFPWIEPPDIPPDDDDAVRIAAALAIIGALLALAGFGLASL